VSQDAHPFNRPPDSLASGTAGVGAVAYEMTLFASRAGAALTPRLIIDVKNAIQA
jgi:hypothetical protein